MASKASILAIMDSNRARLGFGRDRTFIATPNVRNPPMLQEAEAFSHQLRDFENAVREYHHRAQGFLRGLLPVLDSNLPRVWLSVDEASGLAEPLRAEISHGHPSRVGGDYHGEDIHRHLDRLDRGIQEDVLLPLKRWQEGLTVARERMKSLEKLRKEVDGQRRKAEKKFSRAEAKLRKAYMGAGYGTSSSSSSDEDDIVPKGRLLEDYHRLALHTERQLRALMESYEDQERLVWEQLSGLVTDAAWLESYAAATMLKVKEAFQGVALALGSSKQPLPAYRSAAYAESAARAKYGDVGENVELITQMGPRAVELAHGSTPRAAQVLPYQPLRARRGLATPLLVAAAAPAGSSQRRLAQEPVPPVDMGASAVPMHALPGPVRERALRDVEDRITGADSVTAGSSIPPSPRAAPATYRSESPRFRPSPTVTTPASHTAAAPTHMQRSISPMTTTPTAATAGSRGVMTSSSVTPTLSPREREGFSREAGTPVGFGSGTAVPEPLGDSVRATATSGSAAPFGHLAGAGGVPSTARGVDQPLGFEKEGTDRMVDRASRPRDGFGSTTLVEGEGLGVGREGLAGREGFETAERGARTDDVLDSYATPLKEPPTPAATAGVAPASAVASSGVMPTGAGATDIEPATVVPAADPSSYAISNISSTAGSRPTTPGGSSITDAIRAEIARGSPSTPTPPPVTADAGTAGTALGGTAGDTVRPLGRTAGDTVGPLGGTGSEEEQFVDAQSQMSSRASSMSYEGKAAAPPAAAPWSPVQTSRILGQPKQQQMEQHMEATRGFVQ